MRKVEKESKRNTDADNRVLRKENEDLRRQVARLRKALEKAGGVLAEKDDEDDDSHLAAEYVAQPSVARCPAGCKGETVVVSTPTSDILVCKSCKARRKL